MGMQTIILPADLPTYFRKHRFGASLIRSLVAAAAAVTGLPAKSITGPCRDRELVYVRYAIMAVARENRKPFRMIGDILGGRHHTTVMDGVAMAPKLAAEDPEFAILIDILRGVASDTLKPAASIGAHCVGRLG